MAAPMINVILSTYNEAENIVPMVKMVAGALEEVKAPFDIIVVDGGSTDNTADIVERLHLPYVTIVRERSKSGLGMSYMKAIRHCHHEYTFILDADLQHDPFFMPEFLKVAQSPEKYDIVTGTRYARSGMVSKWPFIRKFHSRVSNNLARYVIGLKTSDLTGSYRCYRTSVLRELLLQSNCNGFSVQMELMTRAEHMGLKVAEFPIVFYNRCVGYSKFGLHELLLFIRMVFILYLTV